MEIFFGIIIVVIFLMMVLGPALRRLLGPVFQKWVLGKMEDNMRRMAGMPTRKEEKKARKRAQKRAKSGAEEFRKAAAGSRGRNRTGSASSALQSCAEDVEYTEIKTYSAEVDIATDPTTGKEKIVIEEQIEDAEFIEIKK